MFWDILNKIAIIGTIIGIPVTLMTVINIYNEVVVKYDMFRELNDAGGYTLTIGQYSRKDYKKAKKHYPSRQYHIEGAPQDNDNSWK